MSNDHRFTLAVGALALVAILLAGYFVLRQESVPAPYNMPILNVGDKNAASVPATGKVEDAINAIITDLETEQVMDSAREADADLITMDERALGDFGQSYDEKEF